mmetsp:Transcript_24925/g.67844  ORF Transcript_24925/g.67844 Transcript_24925/m.67844 type:complete len:283 (-) Transcript_24925:950-1798(-)
MWIRSNLLRVLAALAFISCGLLCHTSFQRQRALRADGPLSQEFGCPEVSKSFTNATLPHDLPTFMLNARTGITPHHVIRSWSAFQPKRVCVNKQPLSSCTLSIHVSDAEVRELCRSPFKWAGRLFYVYKAAFTVMLRSDPGAPYFLIFEDDTLLVDQLGLITELNYAIGSHQRFYSFFDDPKRKEHSCVYNFGTTAFLIHRSFMQELLAATICSHPIDIHLSSSYFLLKTQRQLVRHLGKSFNKTLVNNPPKPVSAIEAAKLSILAQLDRLFPLKPDQSISS